MNEPNDPWEPRATFCEYRADEGVSTVRKRIVAEYNDDTGQARLVVYRRDDGLWHRETDGFDSAAAFEQLA